jgi:DNA-binding IclR family transcriptional regulator
MHPVTRDTSSLLQKAGLLLSAFGGDRPLSLRELGERTGLPRSTLHRLVVEVAELGWVHRIGNRYELGMTLFELGELVPVKHRLRSVCLPYMQDLFAATDHTVHLAVRDGHDAVYAEKLHGHDSLPLPSRTGGRAPLTCTGVGKALLAHESAEVVEEVLRRPLRRWTDASILEREALLREFDDVRRTGLAWERGEATPHVACVASPVLVGGRPLAALSVAAPLDRFVPERLGPAVLMAALGAGRALRRS